MMLAVIISALPPYAEDVRRTLSASITDEALTEVQKWGIAHACAEALAYPALTHAVEQESPLSAATRTAIRAAAAVMAVNNVYFRAVHLMKHEVYAHMRSGIRMSALTPTAAASKLDIDLWTLAVSAINACGDCLDAHEASILHLGGSPTHVQAALKLTAALAGAASVLRAEDAKLTPR